MKKSGTTFQSGAARNLRAASGLAARRGFTVIEILVAVGAVAIVTIGLASIFDAVGKTVQGGRRLSVLTQYSTMIENQLRIDFASIDPNSFMVIRQQSVDVDTNDVIEPTDTVELYEGQPAPDRRPRRIDELLIFGRGDFASMRPPIAEERVARSHEARIYYGMGQRMTPSSVGGDLEADYLRPYSSFRAATSAEIPPLGRIDLTPAGTTINRYASEWTLLRHVTVLQQPGAIQMDLPKVDHLGATITALRAADSDGQIALHPAAATIFRSMQFYFPKDLTNPFWLDTQDHPSFATGTVDVATTDLDEIRSFILGMNLTPSAERSQNPSGAAQNNYPPERTFPFTAPGRDFIGGTNPSNISSLYVMQAWMSDAFPTESLPENMIPPYWESNILLDPPGRRIRYETQPPGLRDVLESSTPPRPAYATGALQDAYERSAQVMLTAHNFVPRCTEFIVEWSFGRVNPNTNQLIWHGPPRPGLSNQELCFYPYIEGNNIDTRLEEGRVFNYIYKDPTTSPPQTKVGQQFHPFTDRLIYGYTPAGLPPAALTSYFGYIDPTFDPSKVDAPGGITGVAAESEPMEWPRPKLVRVTMSLADPRDPKLEETFQFVLEVPQISAK